ncbi:MAG: hypothetical protein AB7Q17_15975 [Phycisphaerae bacterium]
MRQVDKRVLPNRRTWTMAGLGLLAGVWSAPARAGDSLAAFVPADAGLFVEMRGADDLLIALTDEQVWLTLADLAGQPANAGEVEQWRAQIRHAIGMDPAEAIRTLFADGVAFVGDAPGRAQDAVLLCRPRGAGPRELLQRWEARPLPLSERVSVYQLRNGVGAAQLGDVLLFGDVSAADGAFPRTLRLAEPAPPTSLASDEEYRALLARAPSTPDGLLFARINGAGGGSSSTQPTTRAAREREVAALPGPLRGADRVLLAMQREDRLLHFTLVGNGPQRPKAPEPRVARLVERLPERTLFAWSGILDYTNLVAAVNRLPERNVLRLAFALQEKSGTISRLVDSFEGSAAIAVGVVEPVGRPVAAPPTPALALLLSTRDPDAAQGVLGTLLRSSLSAYNLLSLQWGTPLLAQPVTRPAGDLSAEVIDLGVLLQGVDGGAIGELQLCWAIDDDVLIVASHLDWLRQIVVARHHDANTLARVLQLPRRRLASDSETVFCTQLGPIADLGGMWLRYLETHAPHALREEWWRQRQPGGRNVRLGVRGTEVADEKRLRVEVVDANGPAAGVVRSGDLIVGCNGQRFATTQPVREIQEGLAARNDARWFGLLIERDGRVTERRIPIPFVDPVQLLRRVAALGGIAQRVVYHEEVPADAPPRGFLTVELRSSPSPLFRFNLSRPPEPVRSDEP